MSDKIEIHLAAVDGGPFNCRPAMAVELEPEQVLCNDIIFPWEGHPHSMRAFVIGHEFGAVALVWAPHDSEAFDVACDAGLIECLMIPVEDVTEADHDCHAALGNAGELHNLDNAWIQEVDLLACAPAFACQLAEARGAGWETLSEF